MSRPLPNTTLNPLGRETSLQQVRWNEQGWLEMVDGSNFAKMETPAPKIAESVQKKIHAWDVDFDFSDADCLKKFLTPYHSQNSSWAEIKNNHLELRGRNSFFSQNNPSILATRATSFKYTVQTKLQFKPEHFSQTAGVGLYYDSNNWLYAHVILDDREEHLTFSILQAKLGQRISYDFDAQKIPDAPIEIKIAYDFGTAEIFYRAENASDWLRAAGKVDVSIFVGRGRERRAWRNWRLYRAV